MPEKIDWKDVGMKTAYVAVGVPVALIAIPLMFVLYGARLIREVLRG